MNVNLSNAIKSGLNEPLAALERRSKEPGFDVSPDGCTQISLEDKRVHVADLKTGSDHLFPLATERQVVGAAISNDADGGSAGRIVLKTTGEDREARLEVYNGAPTSAGPLMALPVGRASVFDVSGEGFVHEVAYSAKDDGGMYTQVKVCGDTCNSEPRTVAELPFSINGIEYTREGMLVVQGSQVIHPTADGRWEMSGTEGGWSPGVRSVPVHALLNPDTGEWKCFAVDSSCGAPPTALPLE